MNRRNAIKAAIAGVAAAVGWKVAKPGPLRGYWAGGDPDREIAFKEFTVYDKADFDAVDLFNRGAITRNQSWLLETRQLDLFKVSVYYGIPLSMLEKMSKEDVECLLRLVP